MADHIKINPTEPGSDAIDPLMLGSSDFDFTFPEAIATKSDVSSLRYDIQSLFNVFHKLDLNARMSAMEKKVEQGEHKTTQQDVKLIELEQKLMEGIKGWKADAAKLERALTSLQEYVQNIYRDNVNLASDLDKMRRQLEIE